MTRTETQRCVICEGEDLRGWFSFRDENGRWSYFRCRDCGHGMALPTPDWEQLAPYYRDDYVAYSSSTDRGDAPTASQVEAARQAGEHRQTPFSPGSQLLDFGCGGGDFIETMTQLGVRGFGVDPSAIAVERCRSRGLRVEQGTSSDVGRLFSERRFDLVTMHHVLEHVPDPVACLMDLARVLHADGRIVIAVPNSAYWACRWLKRRWHSTDAPRHVQQFTIPSLERAVSRAGLRTERVFTYSLPKGVNSSIRQLLRCRLGVPMRWTLRWRLIDRFGERTLGPRLDRYTKGEAIIAWIRSIPAPR